MARLGPDDFGGLFGSLSVDRTRRRMVMDFGKGVTWVSLPTDDALVLAEAFRAMVRRNFGQLPYDPSTLPLKVVRQSGQVVIHMPSPLQVLDMNPEAFLGFADHIDKAVVTH